MATLTPDQVRRMFTDDGPRRWGLFAILGVTTADTIDMTALGYYRKVSQSAFMGCTVTGIAAGTQSGGVITIPVGLNNDSAYVLVDGIPL